MAAFYYRSASPKLGKIVTLLKLNLILLIFVMVLNLYYRLSHSGRVCSGDFLSEAEQTSFEAKG